MHRRLDIAFGLLAAAVLLAAPGCKNPGAENTVTTTPPRAAPVATSVGAACTPGTGDDRQGSCPDGLLCGPAPGGYCTRSCDIDADCGPGAVCTDTLRGTFCTRSCASDGECRQVQGYGCDPDWRVCMQRDMPILADKMPRCASPVQGKGTFGPAVQVTTAAGGSVSDQEVHAALDRSGAVHLAYIARTPMGGPNPLGLARIGPDGRVTTTDARLPDGRENHYDPWMARDRDGRLYLVWLGFDGAIAPEKRMQIGFATSTDGATWSESRSAHAAADCPGEAPGCLDKPMMAIGPDRDDPTRDAVYVAYWGKRGNVVVKSTDRGATFSDGVVASENLYGDIRVDGRGSVHMVDRADGYIEYLRSDDGGRTFSAPVKVRGDTPSVTRFTNPQVAYDTERDLLYIAYPAGGDGLVWDIVLAVSRDRGATFTYHRVNDDPSCAHHMVPSMALDQKTGRVHLMWLENRSGVGHVGYTSCDASGCAANERISDDAMAAYGLTRHTRKWLGEYNVLLIDPERRLLHALWAHPVLEQRPGSEPGSEPVPTARIFYARARLPD